MLYLALSMLPPAALAQAPEAPAEARPGLKWGGYGLPIAGANTTDGFGFGVGGELYGRPPDAEHGYAWKLTAGTWWTISFEYTSYFFQLEHRGHDVHHLFRLGYQGWSNLVYAGSGGADVLVDWGDREIGNRFVSPYALAAISTNLGASPWRVYGQAYARYGFVEPGEGSLLHAAHPLGTSGALYQDATVGLELEQLDRWPMPMSGMRLEIDARLGATLADRGVHPLLGVHAEAIRWWPLAGERLVFGARLVADKSFGRRPFFEQNLLGGRWRDEIGFEQTLTGYGRIRSRGDGTVAALVELRPFIARTRHEVWDFAFSLSLFAEEAWLFDGLDPGPHLPSVGVGPIILFQGASQIRPFLAWGWRADERGDDRTPQLQFGLSLTDPL